MSTASNETARQEIEWTIGKLRSLGAAVWFEGVEVEHAGCAGYKVRRADPSHARYNEQRVGRTLAETIEIVCQFIST